MHCLNDIRGALLADFLNPQNPNVVAEKWSGVIDNALAAIETQVQGGMLGPAPLADIFESMHSKDELLRLAINRNLPASGTKAVIVKRLMKADPDMIAKVARGHNLLVCTDAGRIIAEYYKAEKRRRQDIAETEAIQLFNAGKLKEACLRIAQYEAGQIFARGIGINWNQYSCKSDLAALEPMFRVIPTILSGIRPEHVAPLRTAGALMILGWSTHPSVRDLPADNGTRFSNATAARMFCFYGFHQRAFANYQTINTIRRIEVSGVPDSRHCAACQKISGKTFPFERAPELPYPRCTCEIGCRCAPLIIGA